MNEELKQHLLCCVRWAPRSTYWSQELCKALGDEALEGIRRKEDSLRMEISDAQDDLALAVAENERLCDKVRALEATVKALEKTLEKDLERMSKGKESMDNEITSRRMKCVS